MGTTSMKSKGYYDILEREGMHPPVTMRINGADVFPGMPVTVNGETWPDVCLPDAVGEEVLGVTGLLENQDIGTVYADNSEVPVYFTGHGAIVRMYASATSGTYIYAGELLVADGPGAIGYVQTLRKAIDALAADYTSTLMATTIKHVFSILGRAQETHASSGTVDPIRVLLSV